MATARFRLVSVALYTSPMPPAPIRATTSYGPRRVPGVSSNAWIIRALFSGTSLRNPATAAIVRGHNRRVVGAGSPAVAGRAHTGDEYALHQNDDADCGDRDRRRLRYVC